MVVTFMPVVGTARKPTRLGLCLAEMARTMKTCKPQSWLSAAMCGMVLCAAFSSAGCGVIAAPYQITAGGQTLPSAYYVQDDVQYFAPGPEFKLSREAAAMKAYKAEEELRRR